MLRLAIELTTQTNRFEKIEKSSAAITKKKTAKRGRPTHGGAASGGAGEWCWQRAPNVCSLPSVSEMVTLLGGIDEVLIPLVLPSLLSCILSASLLLELTDKLLIVTAPHCECLSL